MTQTQPESNASRGATGGGLQLFSRETATALMSDAGIDILLPHTQLNAGYLADYYFNIIANWPFYLSETQVPYISFVGLPEDAGTPPFLVGHTGANAVDIGFCDPWIEDRYLFGPSDPENVRVAPAKSNRPVSTSAIEAAVRAIVDRDLDSSVIGIEADYLGVAVVESLTTMLPNAEFVDGRHVIDALRRIKSPEETRRMEVACAASRAAHVAISKLARPGLTGRELARIVKRTIVEHDCDVDFVEVHANRDGALLFAPNDYEIRVGESFVVDIGARYLNYASDMAHNYCIGEPDALTARVHEAGLAAFNAVVNAASVGIIARDLYAIGTKALADRGFDPTYHMMGHGLGRHVHERPVLGPGDDSKLHAGEIIAVEVPMYLPGSCWVQIEENFVVNDSGLRWLEPWNLDICVL